MKTVLEYKGYVGSAEVDVENHALVGKLLYVRDVITYSAESPRDLEVSFREAVDDYLEACAEDGTEPDVPFKGSFNVRVGPERHRDAALIARRHHMGLNEFVSAAIDTAIHRPPLVQHVHKHEFVLIGESKPETLIATSDPPWLWDQLKHGTA